ncbi:hypothetical protein KW798_03560 [Candidatus Parcubacteria bacterium]|nr:hypothetical protein [Candidatus Parcubacteria bacterium]
MAERGPDEPQDLDAIIREANETLINAPSISAETMRGPQGSAEAGGYEIDRGEDTGEPKAEEIRAAGKSIYLYPDGHAEMQLFRGGVPSGTKPLRHGERINNDPNKSGYFKNKRPDLAGEWFWDDNKKDFVRNLTNGTVTRPPAQEASPADEDAQKLEALRARLAELKGETPSAPQQSNELGGAIKNFTDRVAELERRGASADIVESLKERIAQTSTSKQAEILDRSIGNYEAAFTGRPGDAEPSVAATRQEPAPQDTTPKREPRKKKIKEPKIRTQGIKKSDRATVETKGIREEPGGKKELIHLNGSWYVKEGNRTRTATKEEVANSEDIKKQREEWEKDYSRMWNIVKDISSVGDLEKFLGPVTSELDKREAGLTASPTDKTRIEEFTPEDWEAEKREAGHSTGNPFIDNIREMDSHKLSVLEWALVEKREQLLGRPRVSEDFWNGLNKELSIHEAVMRLDREMQAEVAKQNKKEPFAPRKWRENLGSWWNKGAEKVLDIPRKGHIKLTGAAREWVGRTQNKWKKGTQAEKVFMALVGATGIVAAKTLLMWVSKGNAQDVMQLVSGGRSSNVDSFADRWPSPYAPFRELGVEVKPMELSLDKLEIPESAQIKNFTDMSETQITPQEMEQILTTDVQEQIKDFEEKFAEVITPPEVAQQSIFPRGFNVRPDDNVWNILKAGYNRSDLTPDFAPLRGWQKRQVLAIITHSDKLMGVPGLNLNPEDLGIRSGKLGLIQPKEVLQLQNSPAGNARVVNQVIQFVKSKGKL